MNADLLSTVTGPQDVKNLTADELEQLCGQIRTTLVRYGKQHGGHIGSNLGSIELCVALHRVFNSPADKIIFDVSHQAYAHKMVTGRATAFAKTEAYGTVTGFTNPREAEHDQFVLGHTGTAISLACGMAKARDLHHDSNAVIAVIGDGALSSAIAFEGLNNAAELHGGLIIVFNDNEMSIAENHGGMYRTLARMRETNGAYEPNLFEAFGLDYRYVANGNDVSALVRAFEDVRHTDHPIVVHIHTTKGLGLDGEDAAHGIVAGHCEANHWQDPFSAGGQPLGARKHYGRLAMDHLKKRLDGEPDIVVISPATPGSNGITPQFRQHAGIRYVDTGIAEEHAVAFASGLAKAGCRPIVATSATFFQRSFDQLQQEVSLNRQPVTILSFGGGMTDTDNTHSGAFDIAMFGNIPGLTCLAPTNTTMFLAMLDWATSLENTDPVMIRVPGQPVLEAERAGRLPSSTRALAAVEARTDAHDAPWTRYVIRRQGTDVAIMGLGNAHLWAGEVVDALDQGTTAIGGTSSSKGEEPIHATWINPLQFSTLDKVMLRELTQTHRLVVTIEDGQLEGGWGEKITAFYQNELPQVPMHVLNFGMAKTFTDCEGVAHQRARNGMTTADIAMAIRRCLALQE